MSGLIGKKIGMTSIYNSEGKNEPCTVVLAGPCKVTQIKTKDKEGYEALQLAFSEKKKKHTIKSEVGHFAKTDTTPPKKVVEFRYFKMSNYKIGDTITVDLFKEGEFIDVTGVSKGKGFQGVVKRHGFAGVGQATHGQHNRLRAPGSIGAASYPARVFKGMKMAGRLGGERVTVQNLEILKVDKENNLLVIKGCIPGHKNSYIIIQK